MKGKKIGITGANGFVGSELVRCFFEKGWNVTALVHQMPEKPIEGILYVAYELGSEPESGTFSGLDVLVHCAFRMDARGNEELNVGGTKKLLSVSRENAVSQIIFLSSMSAKPDAISDYGKQKYLLQSEFSKPGELVIRPGLVVGNGGVFKKIWKFIGAGRFIPLPGGGKQPVQTIGIDDLCESIFQSVEKNQTGVLTLAEKEPVAMINLYKEIAKAQGKSPVFFSVPYWFAGLGISIAGMLGIRLPAGKANLQGLKMMKAEGVSVEFNVGPYHESISKMQDALKR